MLNVVIKTISLFPILASGMASNASPTLEAKAGSSDPSNALIPTAKPVACQNFRPTLLEMLRQIDARFERQNEVIDGACLLCKDKLSLSYDAWKLHLVCHTGESRLYCTTCSLPLLPKSDHTNCSPPIDVFGSQDAYTALEGFICTICDYMKINDYDILHHLQKDHNDNCTHFGVNVERVTLVPDLRTHQHIIPGFAYMPLKERYRCGAGRCTFHGKTADEYLEHLTKAHRICKTFYCPHCKKMINRMDQTTVVPSDVMRHLAFHSTDIYQCFYCDFVATSDFQMLDHLTAQHDDKALEFWHNNRENDGDSDLVKIALDCNLCNLRVHKVQSSIEHFNNEHVGYDVDFIVFEIIKTTKKDLSVICHSKDSSRDYREILICGLCSEPLLNKHNWVEHFAKEHPSKAMVFMRDFKWLNATEYNEICASFDCQMLFYCGCCDLNDFMTVKCSSTIQGIHDHWRRSHTKPELKQFRFYAAELVACDYCDMLSTFQGLKIHISEDHPDEPFTAIKIKGKQRLCALCDHPEDDVSAEHFETVHPHAFHSNVFDPVPMFDEKLQKLLNNSSHMKVKCGYCQRIYETLDEHHKHHKEEHRDLGLKPRLFHDRDTIDVITSCCHTMIEQKDLYAHLSRQKHLFTCTMCTEQIAGSFEYAQHNVDVHKAFEDVFASYRHLIESQYWRSELYFGNGLVINRLNTQGTEFDHTDNFQQFVQQLIDSKRDTKPTN